MQLNFKKLLLNSFYDFISNQNNANNLFSGDEDEEKDKVEVNTFNGQVLTFTRINGKSMAFFFQLGASSDDISIILILNKEQRQYHCNQGLSYFRHQQG